MWVIAGEERNIWWYLCWVLYNGFETFVIKSKLRVLQWRISFFSSFIFSIFYWVFVHFQPNYVFCDFSFFLSSVRSFFFSFSSPLSLFLRLYLIFFTFSFFFWVLIQFSSPFSPLYDRCQEVSVGRIFNICRVLLLTCYSDNKVASVHYTVQHTALRE